MFQHDSRKLYNVVENDRVVVSLKTVYKYLAIPG